MGMFFLYLILVFLLMALINYVVQLLKPDYPHPQAFTFERGYHYVLYKDGQCSAYMPYSNAKDYAEIFGGKVFKGPRP